MTLAELGRKLESFKRTQLQKQKDRASFDYIQADLIGRSIARIYSKEATYPDISEIYPTLFDSKEAEEQQQARRDELSVIRFKQFTDAYNNKLREGNVIE